MIVLWAMYNLPIRKWVKKIHICNTIIIRTILKHIYIADHAFTSFSGGISIVPNTLLQFKMNPPGDYSDPEPQSGLLHIKNLPSQTTNNTLYDLFRPFGPMNLCKIIIEPGTTVNKGTALIQYFHLSSAEDAEAAMV